MPFVDLEGLSLYYERQGSPDSPSLIIFFNGWCLSARYWQEVVRPLAADHSLLLFDSRGFGRSQLRNRATGYRATIDGGVEEARNLLERLNLLDRRYHVVGHSLGAVTAAHFAHWAEAQGQLVSLTIVNSGSFESNEPQGSQLATFVKIFVKIKRIFALPLIRSAVVSRSVARPIPERYARIITEDFTLADERLALELSLSSLEPAALARYRRELEQITARLLLVVGDRDATIPPAGMYNIRRFKPQAHLVAFPDCGHLPMLEQPARFSQVLSDHFVTSDRAVADP